MWPFELGLLMRSYCIHAVAIRAPQNLAKTVSDGVGVGARGCACNVHERNEWFVLRSHMPNIDIVFKHFIFSWFSENCCLPTWTMASILQKPRWRRLRRNYYWQQRKHTIQHCAHIAIHSHTGREQAVGCRVHGMNAHYSDILRALATAIHGRVCTIMIK